MSFATPHMMNDDAIDLRNFSNTGVIDYQQPAVIGTSEPYCSIPYSHVSETNVADGKIRMAIEPVNMPYQRTYQSSNNYAGHVIGSLNSDSVAVKSPALQPDLQSQDKTSIDEVAASFARRYLAVASDPKQEVQNTSSDIHAHVHEALLQHKEIMTSADVGLHNHKNALELHNTRINSHEKQLKQMQKKIDKLKTKTQSHADSITGVENSLKAVSTAQYRQSSCVQNLEKDHQKFKTDAYKVMMNHRDAIITKAPSSIDNNALMAKHTERKRM